MVAVTAPKARQQVSSGKESKWGRALQTVGMVGGGVVGGIAGNAPGAMAGAAAGANLGGTIGGLVDPAKAGTVKETPVAPTVETGDSAMSRKLEAARQERLAILKQAEAALPQLDPELRRQYAQPIIEATMAEERRKAMGG